MSCVIACLWGEIILWGKDWGKKWGTKTQKNKHSMPMA